MRDNERYYRHLNTKDVLQDYRLILAAETMTYCENNNENYIRYIQMNDLSNDRLAILTNGNIVDMGGNFNKLVDKMSRPTVRGDKRFFRRVQISKKETRFYPNIPVIMPFLKSHMIETNDDMNFKTETRGIRESIPITTTLSMKVIHAGDQISG